MTFNLILAAIAGVVLLIALDFFRFGKATVNERLPKYGIALLASLALAFFINKPVMQYLLLVLAGIGVGRVLVGMNAIAGDKTAARPMAYGSAFKPKTWTGSNWFHFMVVFAFISVISFFQIDSAWADANNFNGFFGWLGIGIVTGCVAIYGLYETVTNSNTGVS